MPAAAPLVRAAIPGLASPTATAGPACGWGAGWAHHQKPATEQTHPLTLHHPTAPFPQHHQQQYLGLPPLLLHQGRPPQGQGCAPAPVLTPACCCCGCALATCLMLLLLLLLGS